MAKKRNTDRKELPIVAIGASAGGLKEFETFFKSFPRMTNVAFVIIQHLDPNHKSMLTDIISRYTEMEVTQINENDEVKPGRCYVIPPNKTLTYSDAHLNLIELKREKGRQLPIDHFFTSLAELGQKAIAIILSGTGSDGTRGIRKLKEHDGLILVQEPKNAQYDGMPANAVKTGVVDVVLPVADMPEVITHYIENDFMLRKKFKDKDKPESSDLKVVFDLLESRTNHKFHEYKSSTILRRIERRMLINQRSSTKEYLELLSEEEE